MKWMWLLCLLLLIIACGQQQEETPSQGDAQWIPIPRVTNAHLRGMHAVSDSIAWASGTDGTVLRTIDGEQWEELKIPGADSQDLRDIHGLSDKIAIAMSSGNGLSIYRTEDGGESWSKVYEDTNKAVFYDGLDLLPSGLGMAYGDPIDGRMSMLVTYDSGTTWRAILDHQRPELDSGEAGYAASGSGIALTEDRCWIATGGGPVSRVFEFEHSGEMVGAHVVPIESGSGSGIFSIAVLTDSHIVAVGGNYLDSTNNRSNCALMVDSEAWISITVQSPRGYRSCVSGDPDGDFLVTVGRTGSDYSTDGGLTWKHLGDEGYFTCDLTSRGGWAAGRNGKMARLFQP